MQHTNHIQETIIYKQKNIPRTIFLVVVGFFIAGGLFFGNTQMVMADPSNPDDPSTATSSVDCEDYQKAKDNPDECSIGKQVLIPIINFLSILVGLVVTLAIVIAGIQYITANGNPQQVASAKGRIFNAILALMLFLFGWALLNWLIPGGVLN